ncbi:hypothetical protein TcasGA2_TC011908 [Tribolium castaneum]|uniref:Uncharacterized protein n=1 Tax=Tribolium castaneum TaxID=7070 RepID=D6X3D2_TRICA|nr:hypothetical protein TcasGA2_TC011908 [Tribolium castaneum]
MRDSIIESRLLLNCGNRFLLVCSQGIAIISGESSHPQSLKHHKNVQSTDERIKRIYCPFIEAFVESSSLIFMTHDKKLERCSPRPSRNTPQSQHTIPNSNLNILIVDPKSGTHAVPWFFHLERRESGTHRQLKYSRGGVFLIKTVASFQAQRDPVRTSRRYPVPYASHQRNGTSRAKGRAASCLITLSPHPPVAHPCDTILERLIKRHERLPFRLSAFAWKQRCISKRRIELDLRTSVALFISCMVGHVVTLRGDCGVSKSHDFIKTARAKVWNERTYRAIRVKFFVAPSVKIAKLDVSERRSMHLHTL